MVLLKTFSGIYNIFCLYNGRPKMSKVALGLRSLVAVVEGITGSLSLFYLEQTEIMFKLYQTFVCLAVFDIFMVGLDLF